MNQDWGEGTRLWHFGHFWSMLRTLPFAISEVESEGDSPTVNSSNFLLCFLHALHSRAATVLGESIANLQMSVDSQTHILKDTANELSELKTLTASLSNEVRSLIEGVQTNTRMTSELQNRGNLQQKALDQLTTAQASLSSRIGAIERVIPEIAGLRSICDAIPSIEMDISSLKAIQENYADLEQRCASQENQLSSISTTVGRDIFELKQGLFSFSQWAQTHSGEFSTFRSRVSSMADRDIPSLTARISSMADRDIPSLSVRISSMEALNGTLSNHLSNMDTRSTSLIREFLNLKERVSHLPVAQSNSGLHLRDSVRLFPFKSTSPMDGIISHLTQHCGGNVHDRNCVRISASSVHAGYAPKNAADFTSKVSFISDNRPGQWIEYDFKTMVIVPDFYSIKSSDKEHLRSWVIEIWDDTNGWREIDRQSNCDKLSHSGITGSFKLPGEGETSRIRLRQTGANYTNTHSLAVSAFEVFGSFRAIGDC
jgi:hypothetical protein